MKLLSLPSLISGGKKPGYWALIGVYKTFNQRIKLPTLSRPLRFQHLPGQHQKNSISPCQTQPGFPAKPFSQPHTAPQTPPVVESQRGLGWGGTLQLILLRTQTEKGSLLQGAENLNSPFLKQLTLTWWKYWIYYNISQYITNLICLKEGGIGTSRS